MTPAEIDRACLQCGGRKPDQRRKYCSQACYLASRWIPTTCAHCGKTFNARLCDAKRAKMECCSRRCASERRRLREGVEFDGHWYSKDVQGYMSSRNRRLHREIWKKANGPIPPDHVIHHIDGNKTNNDLANLAMMSNAEHTRHHIYDVPRLPNRPPPCQPCSHEGCHRVARARGLCLMHYQRHMAKLRGGWPRWVKPRPQQEAAP